VKVVTGKLTQRNLKVTNLKWYIMNKLKPVRCDNCKHFEEDKNYKGEGTCNKDGRYTREHRVCNLLPADEDRRNVDCIIKS